MTTGGGHGEWNNAGVGHRSKVSASIGEHLRHFQLFNLHSSYNVQRFFRARSLFKESHFVDANPGVDEELLDYLVVLFHRPVKRQQKPIASFQNAAVSSQELTDLALMSTPISMVYYRPPIVIYGVEFGSAFGRVRESGVLTEYDSTQKWRVAETISPLYFGAMFEQKAHDSAKLSQCCDMDHGNAKIGRYGRPEGHLGSEFQQHRDSVDTSMEDGRLQRRYPTLRMAFDVGATF
ncbi:hypothetical protein B0T14DRAFT_569222 [Immersiella caudata]|uniref:Uncharacterized protein n=1 Tax=Immersiella caudata TaxID=314043 RepID=A0AA39WLS5_9PEZI|nr:hypothetical protein B0T14DRAFT_569222 [Immersiella caudata]